MLLLTPLVVAAAMALAADAPDGAGAVDVTAGLPNKVRVVAAVPGQNKVLAFCGENYGPATGWSTINGGTTWTQIGKGAGSAALTIQPLGVLFDPKDPNTFWMFGNFAGASGGVLRSSNGGNTFAGLHCQETEGISVDFSDPQRQTLVIGRHEHSQEVFKSADGGKSWTNIGKTLPPGTARSQYPLVIDSQTYLIGCSFTIPYGTGSGGGTPGIYRTTNGGTSWTLVSPLTVFQNPLVVGGTIYWSYYNTKTSDGGVLVSDDKGLTWKAVTASGLNHSVAPMGLSGGRIAAMNKSKFLTISASGGSSWTDVKPALTLGSPSGATYNSVLNAFFSWKANGSVQRLDVP